MKFRFVFLSLMTSATATISAASPPPALQCLWASYHNFKISADHRELIFADNGVLPFSNITSEEFFKNFAVLAETPTAADQMFFVPYKSGFATDAHGNKILPPPTEREEAGRIRFEPFFLKSYGDRPAVVEKDLVSVVWVDGKKVSFNRRYGAATALQKVSEQLSALLKTHPEYKKFVVSPLGGTYNWRVVAGTKNLSVHSFGVAIDINLDHSNYWKWEMKDGRITYNNAIPFEVVEVFERNGFIWGGKWHHYDTMHFEYRPELLISSDACATEFLKYRD
ncbi:M15 family metallopeptidase [Bdellovibrio sp. NC01]|uniref:M15 family metallopeptidase n=1 Tax=Bdellovibrio sp. NC01 TaxID=2220073 RepID=UPI001159F616|nr:M15 family metallopeptidase [Bdellovibrio sp. NC01]